MEENVYLTFEPESDAPDGWEANAVFVRDGRGNVIELEIPDDTEVSENVGND